MAKLGKHCIEKGASLVLNVQVRLAEFYDIIDDHVRDFVGRGWLVDQVENLLDEPGCRFVVLTGGAGVG